jgi:DNA-binding LacI/PurR family transcriptional regulator
MRGLTIAKVAAEAGVGVGTVSRVLNGSPSVSEDTRRRVLEAIAALDYQPSAVARALSTGRTHAVGVVAPFFTQPSVVERLRGISLRLARSGYQLVLFDVERSDQRRETFRALSMRGRVDGVLSISLAPSERDAARLESAGTPVVLVDRDHDALPTVTVDDVEGGRLAASHLLALGHRAIAFVGDEEENPFGFDSSARRRAGFEAALLDAGVPLRPEWVRRGPHGRAAGRRSGAALLALGERPTAIFASSDVQAIGVLEAARDAGVRVPEDLSVIGFDDVEAAAYAGLTTVTQSLEESGAVGADLLLRALAGDPVEGRRLPLAIVERHTTARRVASGRKRGTGLSQRRSADHDGGGMQ